MIDDINRFWIPIAQVLPVFILGLVVEARLALGSSNKTSKSGEQGFKGPVDVIDSILRVVYALVYAIAMFSLVLAFVLSILVLAGGKIDHDDIGPVLIIATIGAVLTGLLPVARLVGNLVLDFIAGVIFGSRRKRKEKRAATRR